jgi:hypothetical protein
LKNWKELLEEHFEPIIRNMLPILEMDFLAKTQTRQDFSRENARQEIVRCRY